VILQQKKNRKKFPKKKAQRGAAFVIMILRILALVRLNRYGSLTTERPA